MTRAASGELLVHLKREPALEQQRLQALLDRPH
jgi:hypothetical protein